MEATTTVKITPAMMAQAFWDMGSDEQADFLAELAAVIQEDHQTNKLAYSHGELQWFYVGEELLKDKRKVAREMLMTIAAPLYLNTLRYAGG